MKKILSGLLFLAAINACAQSWPGQTVTIVSSVPVGTVPDTVGRLIATELEKRFGISVVTENRPGAGGIVALSYFAGLNNRDGNVLFIGDYSTFIHAPILHRKQELLQKIQPVTPLYRVSPVVVTSGGVGPNFSQQTITKQPFFGSWGVGSWGHFCGLEFADGMKVKTQHLPYKEIGAWFADLSNNQMAFSCTTIGTSTPFVKAGKLSFVAVASNTRDPLMPTLPTINEAFGFAVATNQPWIAMYAGNGVHTDVTDLISATVQNILRQPNVVAQLKNLYAHPLYVSRINFSKIYNEDFEKIKKLIEKHNITID